MSARSDKTAGMLAPEDCRPVACHHCEGVGGFETTGNPHKGGGMEPCPWCRGSGIDPDQPEGDA